MQKIHILIIELSYKKGRAPWNGRPSKHYANKSREYQKDTDEYSDGHACVAGQEDSQKAQHHE